MVLYMRGNMAFLFNLLSIRWSKLESSNDRGVGEGLA
jgi:hypothetical protein